MKVEDTYILPDEVTFDKKDMKEQAAASFKAGRREVVDWIESESGHFTAANPEDAMAHYCGTCGNTIIGVGDRTWEAKKREWEIE